jgi:ABC-type phosphate transport system substrate-binding protein
VTIKIKIWRLILFVCWLCSLPPEIAIAGTVEPYEVITHPGVVEKSLSRSALRAIFGMRLHAWPDGVAIKVFVMPDDAPLHAVFSKEKLNVFPYQLRTAWDRLVFSGTGQAPETVTSQEEMLAKVASTPGAIGYLTKSRMDGRVNVLQIK